VTVIDRSGERSLVGAALDAVGRLEGIGPLPGQDGAERMIRANLIFAASEDSFDQQMAAVRSKESIRVARERGSDQRALVLQLSPRTRG
jgi:hypothetical protein